MKFKKSTFLGALVTGAVFTIISCTSNPESPGIEFMPDMYRSPGPETFGDNPNYENGMSAQLPVKNTIARGYMPYPYSNTPEGYEAAGVNLKNPLTSDKSTDEVSLVEKNGKELYSKMCIHCHGEKGDGAGTLKVKGEPFPVPSYYDAAHVSLPDGKMFHSITFGRNLMGSHAGQLTQEERWKLVAYVNRLQSDNGPKIDVAVVTEIKKEVKK